jgi:hypothetical protein
MPLRHNSKIGDAGVWFFAKRGHDGPVTPDERAPSIRGRFVFLACLVSVSVSRNKTKARIAPGPSDFVAGSQHVMAGLVPAIHALRLAQDVDARHKAGHDERCADEEKGRGLRHAPHQLGVR